MNKPKTFQPNSTNANPVAKINASVLTQHTFSGPVPDPETLLKYSKIDTTFPATLIKMAQIEQENRIKQNANLIEIESYVRKREAKSIILGQVFAFLSVLAISILGGFAIWKGFATAGATIVTSTVIGVVAIFITGKRNKTNKTNQPTA